MRRAGSRELKDHETGRVGGFLFAKGGVSGQFSGVIAETTREKTRLAVALPCAYGSLRLYQMLIRLVPRVGSAEPTGAGEVFPWVRWLTHESIASIQKRTHGFWYAGEFILCLAGLFALYGLMVWLAKGVRAGWFLGVAVGGPLIFMGALAGAPAMLSTDTYAYAYYGRLLATYGADAHSAAPAASLADPFLAHGWYQFVPSVYGPLWTVISAGVVMLGGGHVGLTLLMFRLLEVGAALGTGVLIWLILKELAPEWAAQGAFLFLWNPLVVIESGLSGHNDTCMMFVAVLAVWLHLRGWRSGAVVALMLSALIKVITGPLAPLYMLMMLRQSKGWSERAWFLARAGLGVAAAVALSVICARMSLNGLTVHTASSPQFFENNYHELLFKGLRRLLGEPADSIEAPMDFRPYWVATNGHAVLHAGVSNKTDDLARLAAQHPLLAISDEDADYWLRVYDPVNRLQGYVNWSYLMVPGADPPIAERDRTAQRLAEWPPDLPTVREANWLIRVTTWGLFIAFGLLAAWKTRDFEGFLFWGTWFFLAAQLLVFTKIWPWYAIWPLAFGALRPRSAAMWLAVLLSAGMPVMYVLFDFSNSLEWSWLNDYRSIFSIVLPVVIFGIVLCWREVGRKGSYPQINAD